VWLWRDFRKRPGFSWVIAGHRKATRPVLTGTSSSRKAAARSVYAPSVEHVKRGSARSATCGARGSGVASTRRGCAASTRNEPRSNSDLIRRALIAQGPAPFVLHGRMSKKHRAALITEMETLPRVAGATAEEGEFRGLLQALDPRASNLRPCC